MSETRAYHHGNLRAALLEAAVTGVRERGAAALALRELARTVGVSHNAAYRHFGDRGELVAEVAAVGMAELSRHMQRRQGEVGPGAVAADPVRRARARLWQVGRAYVEYALAEPGLFTVAFSAFPKLPETAPSGGGIADEEAVAHPAGPFTQLVACLDDLVEVGWLAPDARPDAELACWSAVHGFAVLCLDGPLRALPPEDRDRALARMLAVVDRSLGASTGHPWPGPPDAADPG